MAAQDSFTAKQLILIKEFKTWFFEESPGNLNLLITGKTGVGKSRLVNALVGQRVAAEGHKLDPCTSKVTSYQAVIEGVPVTVWDSPGLQDGTRKEDEYIQDMKDNIKDIDLMIYCVKMDEARFYDGDKKAIRTLTDEFGKEVWNHAVVALTFANKVEDPDGKDDLKYFKSKLQEWNKQLKDHFAVAGLDPEACSTIPVIPMGNTKKSMRLPDRDNWLSQMLIECFQVMRKPTRREMYRINRRRLTFPPVSQEQDPTTSTYEDIPDEIPLNKQQRVRFLRLIIDLFLKIAGRLSRKVTSCFGRNLSDDDVTASMLAPLFDKN